MSVETIMDTAFTELVALSVTVVACMRAHQQVPGHALPAGEPADEEV